MTGGGTKHPECQKLLDASARAEELTNFVEWLREQGILLCQADDRDRYWPISESYEVLFARYFGIDLAKVEQERRDILNDLAARHK